MLYLMRVRGLLFDPRGNMYIVVLEDAQRSFPIWVGIPEANAIALELEKVVTPRPMTHDLLKSILTQLGIEVTRIVVNDLRENTYYATIFLRNGNSEILIDSRPSDAIALALRCDAPIYVDEEVVRKQTTEALDEWLKNVKPEDFGKYTA
jgi:bifunctional DNase/RNase